MINHVTVKVKDFEKEEAFYEAALTPLGYGKGPAFPGVQAFVAEDGSAVWVSTAADVYGQINVYGVTTKSERHKRSYWTRTADGNGIGGRKAPVPYGS